MNDSGFFDRAQKLFEKTAAQIGALGELAAERHLRIQLGYELLERNWRNPSDRRQEIDRIFRDPEGALVFVEVKTRRVGAWIGGFEAVDRRKRRALRAAIGAYLRRMSPQPRTYRLDVIEVDWPERPDGIRHFEAVPLFRKRA